MKASVSRLSPHQSLQSCFVGGDEYVARAELRSAERGQEVRFGSWRFALGLVLWASRGRLEASCAAVARTCVARAVPIPGVGLAAVRASPGQASVR
jgi:hypothetical protein